MPIKIEKVSNRRQMRLFVDFPNRLYKDVENYVPALRSDDFDTFNRKKNGAYDFCDSECYLAYKDGKVVGRVAAIINYKAHEMWGENSARFGWLDFIEDVEVVKALLGAVEAWGKEKGCTSIKGPLGFTDMDKEGLLVEGFERLSPFTCLYNFPYYDRLLKEAGCEKDVDWTQKIAFLGDELPPMFKYVDSIKERSGIHMANPRSTYELGRNYGRALFHMYNDTFAPLFQFTPLNDRQIDTYLSTYVPILSPKYVAVCLNDKDEPIGFAFCVPSLSKAVKKSGGRLFPFGWIRILRALKKNDTLEALMIGIRPEYQGSGASVLIFEHIHRNCMKTGIDKVILNPELENNYKAQTLFDQYESEPFMRRRSYKKSI